MDIVVWLRSLGLEEYEAAFRDNKINERVLPNLTQEDLVQPASWSASSFATLARKSSSILRAFGPALCSKRRKASSLLDGRSKFLRCLSLVG